MLLLFVEPYVVRASELALLAARVCSAVGWLPFVAQVTGGQVQKRLHRQRHARVWYEGRLRWYQGRLRFLLIPGFADWPALD
jgi:hypothetical protein